MADTVADVLERAADLISKPGAWTQGALARDEGGRALHGDAIRGGQCFCLNGALCAAAGFPGMVPVLPFRVVMEVLKQEPAYWNDRPSRTQGQVVSKLREAAALAREQGK